MMRSLLIALLLLPVPSRAADPRAVGVGVGFEAPAVAPVAPGLSATGAAGEYGGGGNLLGRRLRLNALEPRRRVHAALGFAPEREAGRLLSLPTKTDTRVVRIQTPDGGSTLVVKTASAEVVRRELFTRRILAEFEGFRKNLESPPGVGFRTGWFGENGVLVQEDQPSDHETAPNTAQRAALAVLSYGLGLDDFDSDGVRKGTSGRLRALDFQSALKPLRPNMGPTPLAATMLHVSKEFLNRGDDHRPLVRAWRAWLVQPGTRRVLLDHLAASGFSHRQAARALAVMHHNASLMESQLAMDVAHANQEFLRRVAPAVGESQARALSAFNRRVLDEPGGGEALRRVRTFLREKGTQAKRWRLWPETWSVLRLEEWADLIRSRPKGPPAP